jgi:hypothetical protein
LIRVRVVGGLTGAVEALGAVETMHKRIVSVLLAVWMMAAPVASAVGSAPSEESDAKTREKALEEWVDRFEGIDREDLEQAERTEYTFPVHAEQPYEVTVDWTNGEPVLEVEPVTVQTSHVTGVTGCAITNPAGGFGFVVDPVGLDDQCEEFQTHETGISSTTMTCSGLAFCVGGAATLDDSYAIPIPNFFAITCLQADTVAEVWSIGSEVTLNCLVVKLFPTAYPTQWDTHSGALLSLLGTASLANTFS